MGAKEMKKNLLVLHFWVSQDLELDGTDPYSGGFKCDLQP